MADAGGLVSPSTWRRARSEEHTSELQSRENFVCRLLLEKKKTGHCNAMRHRSSVHYSSRTGQPSAPSQPSRSSWLESSEPTETFFFTRTATTEIYTLSLHDALPI